MTLNATVRVLDARSSMFNTTGQRGIVKAVDGNRVFVRQAQGMWAMWFHKDQVQEVFVIETCGYADIPVGVFDAVLGLS